MIMKTIFGKKERKAITCKIDSRKNKLKNKIFRRRFIRIRE